MAGDHLPARAQHEVVGEVGKDLQVGPVRRRRPLHLAGREESVLPAADDQHRHLRCRGRPGQVETEHVQVGEVRLVLQPVVERPDLGVSHDPGEEHLPGELRRLHDRPKAHRQVGLEELQRVAAQEAEGGQEHPRRWHRGDQHGGRRGVALQVLLDDEAAHRVPDHDRRLGQGGGGFGQVGDILGEPGPAEALAARRAAMPAKIDRLHLPTAVREVAEKMLLPAPCAVPRTMNEQKRRH